ncbi:MAG: thioredoxin [Cyanobacteria bacterium P01_H01_bin.58]
MAEATKYITLTESNFSSEVLESNIPVIVDFWAAWCGPCRLMNPIIDSLATTFEGKAKLAKINIDEHSKIADNYNIMGVPTLLFFKDGNLINRTEGVLTEAIITEKINDLLN